jgi:hypothetical protein
MAQDWSVHALVYFYSVGSGRSADVFYWRLDLEFTDMNSYDIGSYTFTEQSSKIFLMAPPPTSVGGYRVGEIIFNLTKKPLWIHRMGVRLVLGWKWEDA